MKAQSNCQALHAFKTMTPNRAVWKKTVTGYRCNYTSPVGWLNPEAEGLSVWVG